MVLMMARPGASPVEGWFDAEVQVKKLVRQGFW
jgi:hypothetical protein